MQLMHGQLLAFERSVPVSPPLLPSLLHLTTPFAEELYETLSFRASFAGDLIAGFRVGGKPKIPGRDWLPSSGPFKIKSLTVFSVIVLRIGLFACFLMI